MFTTGSKLFLGATTVATVAAVVYGASKGGSTGWGGVVALLSAAISHRPGWSMTHAGNGHDGRS